MACDSPPVLRAVGDVDVDGDDDMYSSRVEEKGSTNRENGPASSQQMPARSMVCPSAQVCVGGHQKVDWLRSRRPAATVLVRPLVVGWSRDQANLWR
jgi:hypothetical protein